MSWWRVLTRCDPLEKGMANHFNILALRTPWTVWKGQKNETSDLQNSKYLTPCLFLCINRGEKWTVITCYAVLSHVRLLWPHGACQAPWSMGILQRKILEWVAMSSSRESSQSRNWTQASCTAGGFFTIWATREAQEDWSGYPIPSPGIFLTQELNRGLLHYRRILYPLSYQGSPDGDNTQW